MNRIRPRMDELTQKLNQIEADEKDADNERVKHSCDYINNLVSKQRKQNQLKSVIHDIETLPGDFTDYYNSAASNGGNIDSFANNHGVSGTGIIDKYTAMRRNGFGAERGQENNVDYDSLAQAKDSAANGKYGDSLDSMSKDLTNQLGLDYTSATNNATYQNLKTKMNKGYMPTTDELGNALGSLGKYGIK